MIKIQCISRKVEGTGESQKNAGELWESRMGENGGSSPELHCNMASSENKLQFLSCGELQNKLYMLLQNSQGKMLGTTITEQLKTRIWVCNKTVKVNSNRKEKMKLDLNKADQNKQTQFNKVKKYPHKTRKKRCF